MTEIPLSQRSRLVIAGAAFLALIFDGVELGLMPVASLSISQSLMGDDYTPTLGGIWYARYTAALMLGAAFGGILLGHLGDRWGRSQAMGISILTYSIFAAAGSMVETQEQMLLLRFLVGLGVGGVWPNGMALVAECWPQVSRPVVTGVMSSGLNFGILILSQAVQFWTVTPDSWKWIFQLAGLPALLGIAVLAFLPESPRWLETRDQIKQSPPGVSELFGPGLWRTTLIGIIICSIPMIGAWGASKWMIPWADKVGGATDPGYKAFVQGLWALGATLGSFSGAQIAIRLGRWFSYGVMSVASCALTYAMFQWTAPLHWTFPYVVFAQGFVTTLFFGWLALYLPELFPVRVRATGSGIAYNSGRFATAAGVLLTGYLFAALGGDYSRIGAASAMVYGLGVVCLWFLPDTSQSDLRTRSVAPQVSVD
ncbi:MAG TPA: MFS transporter [Planctomicrobium sp.]|nr:MFS transporter [Planctomicrobium sp.]